MIRKHENLFFCNKEVRAVIKTVFPKGLDVNQEHIVEQTITKIVNETWRHYHSMSRHIIPMMWTALSQTMVGFGERSVNEIEQEIYFWAALYHDAVYNPKALPSINEEESNELWLKDAKLAKIDSAVIDKVSEIILATYGHEGNDIVVERFLMLDLWGYNHPFDRVLEDELLIRKEYNWVDWSDYKEGRIKFLNDYAKKPIIRKMGGKVADNFQAQIEYMNFVKPNIAIYPGTFGDPGFHIGHLNVLEKAEAIFDKVIIAYCENPDKTASKRIIPAELEYRQVEFIEGSLPAWIDALNYPITVVRGLRNVTDVPYEQNYLSWLEELSTKPFKSVSIFCDPELQKISSSALKGVAKINPEKIQNFIVK